MSRSITKASERWLPDDERRQLVPVVTDQDGTVLIAVGSTPGGFRPVARLAALSGQIQHTAGPSWQQRARIATVLAVGLPLAIGAAYVAARTITALADWAGALFA